MSEENKTIPLSTMKEALTRAAESDLQKMMIATTLRMLAAENAENATAEERAYLAAELKVISDEVDRRHPLEEPSHIYKA